MDTNSSSTASAIFSICMISSYMLKANEDIGIRIRGIWPVGSKKRKNNDLWDGPLSMTYGKYIS